MRRSVLGLLPFVVLACDPGFSTPKHEDAAPAVPTTIRLGGAESTVVIETAPLRLTVLDSLGATVLGGTSGQQLGATHHETELQTAFIEGWDHVKGTDDPYVFAGDVRAATFDDRSASLDLDGFHLDVVVDGAKVSIDGRIVEDPSDRPHNQMSMAFALADGEHVFGLGERYVYQDQRGQKVTSWTEEGGIAVGEKAKPADDNPSPNGPGMTHVPVPFYLSTKGYGLYVDTTYRVGFDVGKTEASTLRITTEQPKFSAKVFVRADPKQTLSDYTSVTGRARLPAPWVFGPRRRVDNDSMALGEPEAELMRKKHIAVTALDDATHFLPNGSEVGRLAALAKWTERQHALGYKAIAYYNAYVSDTSPGAKPLVDYGKSHDLFVRDDTGEFFRTFMISGGGQQVFTIDFTNPEAVTWYESLLQHGLDVGYDGWMLDFGEYLPQKAKMHDGRTGWEMHNAFPVLYQRITTEYLRRVRGDDWMYFARAGWAGTQAYAPITWSGDPAASFDDAKGLPAQVRAGINAGLSGIAFWGSDIGGYACNADPPADKDVLLRWVEFGALSSDMHDENACAQAPAGSPPKWTIWSDPETTDVWARYAKLHTRLFPYIYAAGKEAARTGIPVIRHPWLVDFKTPEAASAELSYYFGPSLYVAPIVRRAATSRELWLPPGTWFDWWTNAPLAGNAKVTANAPLDTLPLYLKSGGIVAMLDATIDTLGTESSPDIVSLDDVKDVLDIRAAIDPVTQQGDAVLEDGTTLSLSMPSSAPPTLPEGIAVAATEAELQTCAACGKIDTLPGGAYRVRITEAPKTEHTFVAGSVLLKAWRHPRPTRVRWDVAVKP
ncbi:MAG: TIM-barrel domain-containing protein [Polyangiales bacterium]